MTWRRQGQTPASRTRPLPAAPRGVSVKESTRVAGTQAEAARQGSQRGGAAASYANWKVRAAAQGQTGIKGRSTMAKKQLGSRRPRKDRLPLPADSGLLTLPESAGRAPPRNRRQPGPGRNGFSHYRTIWSRPATTARSRLRCRAVRRRPVGAAPARTGRLTRPARPSQSVSGRAEVAQHHSTTCVAPATRSAPERLGAQQVQPLSRISASARLTSVNVDKPRSMTAS